MNKWIYIKSDRIIDAYAVASVLHDVSDTEFFLVRRTRYAKLFKKHPHVCMSGFYKNDADSQLITIDSTNVEDFKVLKCQIAKKLGVENLDTGSMYIPDIPEVLDFYLANIFLLFSDRTQEPLNLNFIDMAVNVFKARQIFAISTGTMTIPCIRGSKDYRELITWEYLPLIAIHNKSALIITNESDYAALCVAIGLNYILLENKNGIMYANNQALNHPNELINLINQQIS